MLYESSQPRADTSDFRFFRVKTQCGKFESIKCLTWLRFVWNFRNREISQSCIDFTSRTPDWPHSTPGTPVGPAAAKKNFLDPIFFQKMVKSSGYFFCWIPKVGEAHAWRGLNLIKMVAVWSTGVECAESYCSPLLAESFCRAFFRNCEKKSRLHKMVAKAIQPGQVGKAAWQHAPTLPGASVVRPLDPHADQSGCQFRWSQKRVRIAFWKSSKPILDIFWIHQNANFWFQLFGVFGFTDKLIC